MARLITSGFELDSVTAGIEVDVVTGSPTITSSTVHSGTYALNCNPSSATAFVQHIFYSANTSNKVYVRIYIYINSLPSANTAVIKIANAASSQVAVLILKTNATLTTQNSSGTTIGSASGALSLNTWYCLELSIDASISNGTIEARLNGNVFTSAAGNNSTGVQRVFSGIINSATANIIIDDVAVNDTTGSAQTGYPGLGNIVRATPNAAGDSNTFATQVGGTAGSSNNYTRVNETTPDDATSYNASAVAASDLFGVSVPTIPAGSTINCVVVGSRAADLVGADTTASYQTQIEKTTGGTISKSSAIIPSNISWKSNPQQPGASTYLHTLYTDPNGSAWTPATIASMQVGYIMDVTHTDAIAVSTVWALVDYTPPTTPTNNSGFFNFF